MPQAPVATEVTMPGQHDHADLALLEFDASRTALLEPGHAVGDRRLPERLVLCFFQDVIDALVVASLPELCRFRSEIGDNPVWVDGDGPDAVAVMHPGVGAPLAAAFLEEAVAAGARKVVAVGGAGALAPELALGHVVVPTAAIRDEGTSFHYLPPAREVTADEHAVATTVRVLDEHGVPHLLAKTWTTDGLYRETPERIARRRAEGCATVEMETAAFYAVARFRGITFTQLLYAADDLAGEAWEGRGWMEASRIRASLYEVATRIARVL